MCLLLILLVLAIDWLAVSLIEIMGWVVFFTVFGAEMVLLAIIAKLLEKTRKK